MRCLPSSVFTAALLAAAVLLPALSEAGVTRVHMMPLDLDGARIRGMKPLPPAKGWLACTARSASLASPVIESEIPFDDLVGSWNAELPRGAVLEMHVQVRQGGRWSKWYGLGRWAPLRRKKRKKGPEPPVTESLGRQEDGQGTVDVDTLRLKEKADAYRYRVVIRTPKPRRTRLSRVAVAIDDTSARMKSPLPFRKGPWVRDLAVPERSQRLEHPDLGGRICSPTSVSMVLDFWKKRVKKAGLVPEVYDRAADAYGNWPFNVAAAAAHGLPGYVARLPGFEPLQDEIAAGRPVVVSITFKDGALSGSPTQSTEGHLLVVRGFTDEGDVIVNDPASRKLSEVRRVYRRSEFAQAWLENKRGLAYVLGGALPGIFAVGVPVADIRTAPRARSKLLTQVLYGERVRVLAFKGDYAEVEALDQPYHGKNGVWGGYPGWMRADTLRLPPAPYEPAAVVRTKSVIPRTAVGIGTDREPALPLGSMLETLEGARTVPLLRGRMARIPRSRLHPLGERVRSGVREGALQSARSLLGEPYRLGGLSSLGTGIDCSGLVHLSYRSKDFQVPRDARHQFLRAHRIRSGALRPGDPVFLTESGESNDVNHVMLYAGGDALIESRESAGSTVRTTFTERFGAGLKALRSGQVVTDRTREKPVERRIYFGSFLERP